MSKFSKFKVGDRVRILDMEPWSPDKYGDIVTVIEVDVNSGVDWDYRVRSESKGLYDEHNLELVTSKGVKTVTEPKKHLYRLKKDAPEYKAGMIIIEQCEDGTQDFDIHPDFYSYYKGRDASESDFDREVVVDNPSWFEEVTATYTPVVKGRKPVKAAKKTASAKSAVWAPERRAAASRRMKRIRKQRAATWGK